MINLIAKLKITQHYPYKIPNTNITIISDSEVEIDSIYDNRGKCKFCRRKFAVNLVDFIYKLQSNSLSHSGFCVSKQGNTLGLFFTAGGLYYESKDFIHILAMDTFDDVGTLFVIDKSDLSLVKKKNVTRSRVPKYEKSPYNLRGMQKVGELNCL